MNHSIWAMGLSENWIPAIPMDYHYHHCPYYICYLWASPIFKQTHIAVLLVNYGVIRPICYSSQSCTAFNERVQCCKMISPCPNFRNLCIFLSCHALPKIVQCQPDDDPINQLGFPKFTSPGLH